MPDSGLGVPMGDKWYNTKDIFERLEAHAKENVDSFSALGSNLVQMEAQMAKLSYALELMALRLEPLAELRQHICVVESKADAAHRRLDDIRAESEGRQGVSKSVLWVMTLVSTGIAICLGILHLMA